MATKEDIELSLMCSLHPNVLFVIRSTETRSPPNCAFEALFLYFYFALFREQKTQVGCCLFTELGDVIFRYFL